MMTVYINIFVPDLAPIGISCSGCFYFEPANVAECSEAHQFGKSYQLVSGCRVFGLPIAALLPPVTPA
jgi:hypothetical protein